MKIVDTVPLQGLMQASEWSSRSGEAHHPSFDRLLVELTESDGADARKAAAFSPEIGTHAQRFQDKPILLLSAVDLTGQHPPAIWATPRLLDGEARLGADAIAAAVGEWIDQLGEAVPRQEGSISPAALTQGPGGDRAFVAQDAVASVKGGARDRDPAPSGTAGRADHAAPHAQLAGVGRERAVQLASTKALAGLAANVPAAKPGHQTPFSALLFAHDDGLRLVIRVPALSSEERERLEERIVSLFAARGLIVPETRIHQAGPAEPRRSF